MFLQAPTVEVKVAWLTEIRKILNIQQKIVKGSYISSPFFFTLNVLPFLTVYFLKAMLFQVTMVSRRYLHPWQTGESHCGQVFSISIRDPN